MGFTGQKESEMHVRVLNTLIGVNIKIKDRHGDLNH